MADVDTPFLDSLPSLGIEMVVPVLTLTQKDTVYALPTAVAVKLLFTVIRYVPATFPAFAVPEPIV
ncbi:hypothetical protein D3C75_1204210 [compost metagenome]